MVFVGVQALDFGGSAKGQYILVRVDAKVNGSISSELIQ
jgi:hypothetical protein